MNKKFFFYGSRARIERPWKNFHLTALKSNCCVLLCNDNFKRLSYRNNSEICNGISFCLRWKLSDFIPRLVLDELLLHYIVGRVSTSQYWSSLVHQFCMRLLGDQNYEYAKKSFLLWDFCSFKAKWSSSCCDIVVSCFASKMCGLISCC